MNKKPRSWKTIFIYLNACLLLMLIGAGTYYAVRIYTRGQTCYTVEQVQQDNRCLYIYQNMVFEKGTKSAPHQGNPCGSDVTSIIPNSHLLDKVGHLDPNYQGQICANNPAPTATPTPTTPAPTATTAPTNTPVPPTATPTMGGTNVPTNSPTPTPVSSGNGATTAPTATRTPTPTVSGSTASSATATPTTSQLEGNATETISPTVITSLPVTGRLEWLAVVLIPVILLAAGMAF